MALLLMMMMLMMIIIIMMIMMIMMMTVILMLMMRWSGNKYHLLNTYGLTLSVSRNFAHLSVVFWAFDGSQTSQT